MKILKPYKQNIISIVGRSNYTTINLLDGRQAIYAKTLKKFELELSEQKQFVRVSKSVIVNLSYVDKINKDTIELCNGTSIKISRRRKIFLYELVYDNQMPISFALF